MPRSCVLPPLEFWSGTKPIHAANCRAFLKLLGSPALATNSLAVMGPIPGMVSNCSTAC